MCQQDWEAMTQLLLEEKCGIILTDVEEAVLIEIMACSVRRASGATPPSGRAKGKVICYCHCSMLSHTVLPHLTCSSFQLKRRELWKMLNKN